MALEVLSVILREGIEMVLLLSIILIYLEKTGRKKQLKYVYIGLISAIVSSIAVAAVLKSLETKLSPIAESVMFFVPAVLVLSVIFWFHFGSKHLTKGFSNKFEKSISSWQDIGIFLFTFLVIFREGVEIVVLILTVNTDNLAGVYIESIIGILLVAVIGYFIIKGSLRIDMKRFFRLTTIMLSIVFVELIMHGLFELVESHIIDLGYTVNGALEYFVDGSGHVLISGLLLVLLVLFLLNVVEDYRLKPLR